MASFTDAPTVAPVVAPKIAATAAQLLKAPSDHPVKANFIRFCGGKDQTIRQARKYFAAYPKLAFLLLE